MLFSVGYSRIFYFLGCSLPYRSSTIIKRNVLLILLGVQDGFGFSHNWAQSFKQFESGSVSLSVDQLTFICAWFYSQRMEWAMTNDNIKLISLLNSRLKKKKDCLLPLSFYVSHYRERVTHPNPNNGPLTITSGWRVLICQSQTFSCDWQIDPDSVHQSLLKGMLSKHKCPL